jgi:hypothetical protein
MKKILYCLLCVLLVLPLGARAAVLSFDPQENTVGTTNTFLIALNLSTATPVNVIDLAIRFPSGLEPVDISDGNSVVSMWITKPVFDESLHVLTLTGFIPGGYAGINGRVVTLSVEVHTPGSAKISVDAMQSHLYRNDPPATEEPFSSVPLAIAVEQANNVANDTPDIYPPETFAPSVSQLPTDSGEAWMVVFAAQDKGSGVDHYEVREINPLMPWLSQWHVAESPYLLSDQSLRSRIEVRAVDKKGNVREEFIEPVNTMQTVLVWTFATLLLAFILMLVAIIFRSRKL